MAESQKHGFALRTRVSFFRKSLFRWGKRYGVARKRKYRKKCRTVIEPNPKTMNSHRIIKSLLCLWTFSVLSASAFAQTANEVVILDENIKNKDIIIQSLRSGIRVIELEQGTDQFSLLSSELAGMKDLKAVHLLLCGKEGFIMFDGMPMNNGNLCENYESLSEWRKSFGQGGDILIYTCNLAKEDNGKLLTRRLSSITGLDVAASVNLTGNDEISADWSLEFMVGKVETQLCFDPVKIRDYPGRLQRSDSN